MALVINIIIIQHTSDRVSICSYKYKPSKMLVCPAFKFEIIISFFIYVFILIYYFNLHVCMYHVCIYVYTSIDRQTELSLLLGLSNSYIPTYYQVFHVYLQNNNLRLKLCPDLRMTEMEIELRRGW